MHPQLLTIPFINVTVPTFGFFAALGFLAGLIMARWRCKKVGLDPNRITDFGVYALMAGLIGARIFYVLHFWDEFSARPIEVFAIWQGGLEIFGGVMLATAVMVLYFRRYKLPILRFLDVLAPALILGLAFGRGGCLMRGCCWGKQSDLPWSIRFPAVNDFAHRGAGCEKVAETQYSLPFGYQLMADPDRPDQRLLELPADYYFNYYYNDTGKYLKLPKPTAELTGEQVSQLRDGTYKMHPVHPAQIYSAINSLLICLVLNLVWRYRRRDGWIFAFMLVLYGVTRFFLESLRVNVLTFSGLSISQNIAIVSFLAGIVMFLLIGRRSPG